MQRAAEPRKIYFWGDFPKREADEEWQINNLLRGFAVADTILDEFRLVSSKGI